MLRFLTFLAVILSLELSAQHVLSPMNPVHTSQVEAHFTSKKLIQPTAFAPFLMKQSTLDSIMDGNTKNWSRKQYDGFIMRRLKNEHLVEIRKADFTLNADITLNLEAGRDRREITPRTLYVNSRGYNVNGTVGERFFYSTTFFENQARLPQYLDSVVSTRGSVPGYARVKDFNTSETFDYDYSVATGYAGVAITEGSFIQFGHDRQFIGHGHRSLLLSDGSSPYTFVRGQVSLWKNRITYGTTYAMRQTLNRVAPNYNNKEAMFQRDYWKFSYLEFQPWWWISLGAFTSTDFGSTEQFVPITLAKKSDLYPSGIDLAVRPFVPLEFYAQWMAQYGKTGLQVGYNLNIDLGELRISNRMEYNTVESYAYIGPIPWPNMIAEYDTYSHMGQPLGYNLGPGASEFIGKLDLTWRDLIFSVQYNGMNVSQGWKQWNSAERSREVDFFRTELGYLINPKTNMQAVFGIINRNEDALVGGIHDNYVYFAFRTQLLNRYVDY